MRYGAPTGHWGRWHMKRPEIWTAAALVVFGIGLAIWLAASRSSLTPEPPADPGATGAFLAASEFTGNLLDGVRPALPDPGAELGAQGLACGLSAKLVAGTKPNLQTLVVVAPCHAGDFAEVAFGPIRFEIEIDPQGMAHAQLPPLLGFDFADVMIGKDSVSIEVAKPENPPLVLGLSGNANPRARLEVYEAGQLISRERPGEGRLVTYGQKGGPYSEFYVLEAARALPSLRIHTVVEAGASACGTGMKLVAFDTIGGALFERSVELAMPPCGPSSDALRLTNLIDDIRVPPQ